MVEIANTESKPKLREQAQKIVKSVQDVKDKKQSLSKQRYHYFAGKCDWCGHSAAEVAYLYDSTKLGLLFVWRKPATIASEYGL